MRERHPKEGEELYESQKVVGKSSSKKRGNSKAMDRNTPSDEDIEPLSVGTIRGTIKAMDS